MQKTKHALLRQEFERDLRPFGVTNEEIDALMEQCGYVPRKFIVVNVNRGRESDGGKEKL